MQPVSNVQVLLNSQPDSEMDFVAMVRSGGVAVSGTLAAYMNGEMRGVAASTTVAFGPYGGQPDFHFRVYGDSMTDDSNEITFK